MTGKIHFLKCPACGSIDISHFLTSQDYSVSGEEYAVFLCKSCCLRFTQDPPDAAAIGKYYKSEEYISHSDISRGLVNKLFMLVRKKTLNQKRKLVERQAGTKRGKILDFGSGSGAFAAEMQRAGWEVTGLEPNAHARQIAESFHGIRLSQTDQLFNLPQESFHAITLWHVLEHVHELDNYLEQFRNLLKQDGKLFLAVPNYDSLDAKFYKEYWAGYDVPRHLYHFNPVSMKKLVEKKGFKLGGIKPMWYDSFYVSLLSSKYKKGRTMWLNAFWIGLRSNLAALANREKCSSLIYIVTRAN